MGRPGAGTLEWELPLMGEHRRRYPALPAGHFHVVDPDGRDTYWSVDYGGRLRDYPPGQRWRPLPPPKPEDVPAEEREAWRAQWYEDVYWTYKNAIAEAISVDPLAAHRFRDRYAAAEIPEPQPRARGSGSASSARRRRQQWRPLPPLTQRQAAEALAAHALAQAGMSVRQIAETLGLPRMTAWRRVRATEAATGVATAGALLSRADRLQASLLAQMAFYPEHREELAGLIRDLREAVRALATGDRP
jgi:hypothetical protein